MRIKILWAVAIVNILVINFLIVGKEKLIQNGEEVYLELAPVDPRSLLQGDYMQLRYQMSGKIRDLVSTKDSVDGYVIASIDNNNVASSPRMAKENETVDAGFVKLFFRKRGRTVKVASGAYFFQEGHLKKFRSAKYGVLKVAANGESVLVGLADREFVKIK